MKLIVEITKKDNSKSTWLYDVEQETAKKICDEHAEMLFVGIIKNYEVKLASGLCQHERLA